MSSEISEENAILSALEMEGGAKKRGKKGSKKSSKKMSKKGNKKGY